METKSKMQKLVLSLGLAAVMLLGATFAFAQAPGSGPGPGTGPGPGAGYGPGHGKMGYHHEMGEHGRGHGSGMWGSLTADQKTKLKDLWQKFNEETVQVKGAIYTKRLELQALWANPKSDPKMIMDKSKELGTLLNQFREKRVQFRLEARKVLTPEQIEAFAFMHMHGRGHMRGHGMGMGMGRGMGMRDGGCE